MFDGLYKINGTTGDGYLVGLDKENMIFKVHFEGNPVLPGACMIEIAKELIELKINEKVKISNIRNLRFFDVVKPTSNNEIIFSFDTKVTENEMIEAKFLISDTSTGKTFAKFTLAVEKAQ